ncbi:valacyclovir hydrolase-like [Sycon ciliatum]|uniref:valacyclovir hydrolase-like n=1 Tax=Sycon ciliatum TaxID=27933 RepID=UPI0020A8AE5C|eukprot:scpid53633/ scgid25735/ Valacyclovir hydrolase; Biphenyl hydrolase-like protein
MFSLFRSGSFCRVLCRSSSAGQFRGPAVGSTGVALVRQLSAAVRMDFESGQREMTTTDGVRIVYYDLGEAKAEETIILVPGALGFSQSDYEPQITELSKDFRVLAMDPRGQGKSRPPERDFPQDFLRREASDAAQVVEAAGAAAGKVNVLGWSDGANIGAIMAAQRPDLVKRLVMWGGNAYITQEDVDLYNAAADTSTWSPRMAEPFVKVYGADGLQKMWTDWLKAMQELLDAGGDICREDAKKVTCPTLLLHGDKDGFVPGFHAEFYRKTIPAPLQYKNFPDGKHNIHLRYAQEFNEIVRRFLRGEVVGETSH